MPVNDLDIYIQGSVYIQPYNSHHEIVPVKVLKNELRRLERNQEREKSGANLEYLKNVLLQFIFLRSGSEKQALLPVIHTMLQLSPEEKNKLAAVAQGTFMSFQFFLFCKHPAWQLFKYMLICTF